METLTKHVYLKFHAAHRFCDTKEHIIPTDRNVLVFTALFVIRYSSRWKTFRRSRDREWKMFRVFSCSSVNRFFIVHPVSGSGIEFRSIIDFIHIVIGEHLLTKGALFVVQMIGCTPDIILESAASLLQARIPMRFVRITSREFVIISTGYSGGSWNAVGEASVSSTNKNLCERARKSQTLSNHLRFCTLLY